MAKNFSKRQSILLKSESWAPPRRRKSKMDEAQEAIFNLRYVKRLSLGAVKKFLAETGILASTGALSAFCRSRFAIEERDRMKSEIASQLESLTHKSEEGGQTRTIRR
jgi:hypothetical protein